MRWTSIVAHARFYGALLLALLLVLVAEGARAQAVPAGPDSVRIQALHDLYASTDGDHWVHRDNWPADAAGWAAVRTLDDCGSWYGVQLGYSDHRYLAGLALSNNNLRGQLPASISQLTDLNFLELSNNQLAGPLPADLGNMRGLGYLNLSFNQLSGPLPASVVNLRGLGRLSLRYNSFTGPLPAQLGNLRYLNSLELDHNQLTGPLPASLGRLAYVEYFYLYYNRFSGAIPDSLGGLTNALQVLLDNNQLEGAVPASLAHLPRAYLVSLSNNHLRRIPSWIAEGNTHCTLLVDSNWLDFGSLEPNFYGPQQPLHYDFGFAYWNQYDPAPPDTVAAVAGTALALRPGMGGRHNRYQWQRLVGGQWADIPGAADSTLVLPRIDAASEGTYRTRVTNDWISGFGDPYRNLTLYSRPHYVDALPYPPLARNRPDDANQGAALVNLDPASDANAGAPADVNFVRTWAPRVALTNAGRVGPAPVDSVSTSTQYLDGLGRPVQTVLRQASPQRRDLVQPVAYDALGREVRQYLPYPDSVNGRGGYRYRALADQQAFYARTGVPGGGQGPLAADDPTLGVARTGAAFAETMFEASPLNRVAAQGAAGEAWQLTAGHVQERWERPNAAQDSVPRFAPGYEPADRDPHYQGFYAAGALWGTEVADAHGPNEPGAHGYRTVEWKDKEGHVVLKQVEAARVGTGATARSRWLRTAYAYDDFGHLRYVLQPEGVKALIKTAAAANSADPGLQVWLPLDETGGTQALNLSGTNLGGTLSGGTWQPTGGHDGRGALALVEAEHLDVPLTWQPTTYSVSFWLKPTRRFNWSQGTGAAIGWGAFLFHSTADGDVYVGTDVPTRIHLGAANTVELGVWQHFVFAFDNGVGTLYKNGRVLATQAGMTLPQPWQGLRLGGSGDELYDDVRVYNRALSAPEVQVLLQGASAQQIQALSQAQAVQSFLFHYRYDGRGRQIAKQVPGQDGETLVVYDQLDRPVLTQDAAQRTRQEWAFTKYDALERAVLQGLVTRPDGAGQPALQAQADAAGASAPQSEQRTANGGAYPQFYTTDRAYPRLGQDGFGVGLVLAATYYDDYDFDHDGAADAAYDTSTDAAFAGGAAPVADAQRVTGQVTRTLARVLNRPASDPGAEWLATTTFYDARARPVQVQATNARGGQDLLTTQLDFPGQVVQRVAVHRGPNLAAPVQVAEFFTYDHTGRLLATRQQLPGEAQPALLARVQYNEIGQALRKTMGTGRLAQDVDYAYNIRGWLTGLNDAAQPNKDDLFSLSLHYERGFTKGYEQYNGNLTGQTWRGRDGVQRAYGYVYDPLNRLLQGDFVARAGGSAGTLSTATAWNQEQDHYRLAFVSYDDNGNIKTLRRQGLLANATHATAKRYGAVDNLNYAYAGNRLQAVDDAVSGNQLARPAGYNGAPVSLAGDFQEQGVRQDQEYFYDPNGNLTQDRNKGIGAIRYNHLNLPRQIQFGSGADSIVFRYAATGQKVAKLVYQTGKPVQRTDYLGPYQYEGDSLRFFPHAEGRVLRFAQRDAARQWHVRYQREFTVKDHLGNLRLAYRLGDVRTYVATLEPDSATRRRETRQFDSLSVSAPVAVATPWARTNGYAAKLNAGAQPLGPLMQLAVQKGDTLRVSAPGLYPQKASSNGVAFSLASFVASLLQPAPAGGPAGVDGRRRGGLPLLQVGLNAAALTGLQQLGNGVPKGYLRVLVFDEDSALVDQRTVQLTQAALGNYETLRTDLLPIAQNGYVTVYVGNESPADVFFDDVAIEHRQGLQVQENQYDPYGLDLAGVSGAAPGLRLKNYYQFNGKENQLDLGLNWNHHDWRFYDYQLGSWHSVDPEAEEGDQESWTTYQFGFDNAIRYEDADGRFPFVAMAIGAAVGAGMEYGVQVLTNVAEGRTSGFAETMTGGNVNGTKIALAGAAGAVGALTGAVFGQVAASATRIASASRIATSSPMAGKVLGAGIKAATNLVADATSSVVGSKIQGKEITAAGLVTDVVGGSVTRKVQGAIQRTPGGQVLRRALGRATNNANGANARASRIIAMKTAQATLDRKGAAASAVASGVVTNAASQVHDSMEKKK